MQHANFTHFMSLSALAKIKCFLICLVCDLLSRAGCVKQTGEDPNADPMDFGCTMSSQCTNELFTNVLIYMPSRSRPSQMQRPSRGAEASVCQMHY